MPLTRAELDPIHRKMEEAYDKRDYDAFANFYTADCKVALSGKDKEFCGHAGVKEQAKFYEEWEAKIGKVKLKFEITGVHGITDDCGWEEGSYSAVKEDGTRGGGGRFLLIWKKVDGTWKIHRDISNET